MKRLTLDVGRFLPLARCDDGAVAEAEAAAEIVAHCEPFIRGLLKEDRPALNHDDVISTVFQLVMASVYYGQADSIPPADFETWLIEETLATADNLPALLAVGTT